MSRGSEDPMPRSGESRSSTFESESSYYSEEDDDETEEDDHVPFFADATLDLEEAQGIASTPIPSLKSPVKLGGMANNDLLPVAFPNLQTTDLSAEASGIGTSSAGAAPLMSISSRSVSMGSTAVLQKEDGTTRALQRLMSAGSKSQSHSQKGHGNDAALASVPLSASVPISVSIAATSNISSRVGRNTSAASSTTPTSTPTPTSTYTTNAIWGGMNSDSGMSTNGTSSGPANNGHGGGQIQSTFNLQNPPVYRPRPPHRPRDSKWTTTFFVSLPLLFIPFLLSDSGDGDFNKHEIHKADIYIILTLGMSLLLARVFYLSRGGGEGDDQRHKAGQILLVANIASCGILPLVTISFYNLHISGGFYDFILAGLAYWTVRDIFFAARLFQSGRYIVEGVNDGQRAFFRMLVNVSLDILSRSFRCQSFYRVICILLMVQLGILLALRRVLGLVITIPYPFDALSLSILVGVVGYWCVNVVIRFLGYLACGGVTAWFAQQESLIQDIERMRRREEGDDFDEDEQDTAMPEAYRNVDASAYSIGIEFDEGMDDDFGDDAPTISDIAGLGGTNAFSRDNDAGWNSSGNGTTFRSDGGGNVKSFCKSAIGVSFGSIVHCAIVGGVANMAWDFLRTVEWIASLSSRFAPLRPGNFRGMAVGDASDGSVRDRLMAKWQWLISASRAFVRNRNDLALCHVAAYYKTYTRAANDVMSVIDVSGE